MKEKDVIIDLESRLESDGDVEDYQITTFGTYSGKAGDYSIEYTEHGGELDGCVTTVRVQGGRCVTLTRRGSYNSELTVEHKKRHMCHYDTPYGALMMGIFAQSVDSDMDDVGGTLKLKYTVDFNSDLVSVNEMTITVKEKS